ncbi:hypothetical protein [Streptomyces sp. NPDC056670]|uniref:hypothetical protein n=1 Tax=Streptomyces sp. NPDC056670 TaxID=3345904 RepID=UPI0036A6FCF3
MPGEGMGHRAELVEAEVDSSRQHDTNPVGVWFAVESAYQNTAIGRNRAKLAAARDAVGRAGGQYQPPARLTHTPSARSALTIAGERARVHG